MAAIYMPPFELSGFKISTLVEISEFVKGDARQHRAVAIDTAPNRGYNMFNKRAES